LIGDVSHVVKFLPAANRLDPTLAGAEAPPGKRQTERALPTDH
jgi:hypothetical protein